MSSDPRIPVLRGAAACLRPGDAVLLPPGASAPPGHPAAHLALRPAHVLGCACCPPRGEAARMLGRLFLARARGEVAFFGRVLLLPPSGEDAGVTASGTAWADAAWAEVARAVTHDVLAAARYRLLVPSADGA